MSVAFQSDIDQAEADEGWAFSDFKVTTSAQPIVTDSFSYDLSYEMKSILLDDDGCFCDALFEAGKLMRPPDVDGAPVACGTLNVRTDYSAGVGFMQPSGGTCRCCR